MQVVAGAALVSSGSAAAAGNEQGWDEEERDQEMEDGERCYIRTGSSNRRDIKSGGLAV